MTPKELQRFRAALSVHSCATSRAILAELDKLAGWRQAWRSDKNLRDIAGAYVSAHEDALFNLWSRYQ